MRYHVLTLLLFVLLPAPAAAQSNCAPAFYGYRFLDPALLDYDSHLGPIYRSFVERYGIESDSDGAVARRDNVAEWYERYCEQVEPADLETVIYVSSVGELQGLLRLMDNKDARGGNIPGTLRNNSFARHLVDHRCTEVLSYLIFAKRAEPYVTRRPAGFARSNPDRVAMERLIDEGLELFLATESHYVRLRYAYQLVRLAHYLGEYDYVVELYDYLMPKVEANPSILYDWVLSHYAGALQSLGEYARSAHLFSLIFARTPSRRAAAYNSFRIRTDEQWRAALLLSANDEERALLHVLRAQNPRAVLLDELDQIYLLDPDNTALEPLVLRELLELERDLLGVDFNPEAAQNRRRQPPRPRPAAGKRLVELQAFVNKVVNDGRAANPDLWLLARATLEMLAGDYFYARRSFAELADRDLADTLAEQAAILSEVTNVLALNRINDSVELYYFDLLADDDLRERYPDLRPLVNDKLEAVYRANGRTGKAALLQYGFDALQKNPQLNYVRELENMADSLLGNRFDRALLAERVGPNPVDDINDLLGTYYLQQGRWETAIGAFEKIPTARRDAYGVFAPFAQQLNDRVNFQPSAAQPRFNKVDLLLRLVELEDQARRTTNDTLAARNFFNMGLAFYNMSYFGYNWRMTDYFRSATSAARAARRRNPDWVFTHPDAPLGNRENMDMSLAREFFERALERAPTREAAARAAFFAAKAQRNEHYAAGSPGPRPFTYFRLLKEYYDDTDFYQTAVAECRTFAWFVGR